jgi:hypothetical protein
VVNTQTIKIIKITPRGREVIAAAPASMLSDVIEAIAKKNKEQNPIGYDVLYSYILEPKVLMYEFDEEINL